MTELAIDIQQASKHFGKTQAVKDLNLAIPRGIVFGFLGENGAGKTTTIRMMVGLLRPDQGTIKVMGMDPLGEDISVKEKFGYVSEDRGMYRWMKVKEILWFNKGLYPHWDEPMAAQLLKEFDLDPDKKVKALSRGMVAKVAILSAMASRPDILILDEPTSGLDPMVRREILEKLVAYCADYGTTVFFSSHLIDDIERLADTVGIICKGKLVIHDEKQKVKDSLKRAIIRLGKADTRIPSHPGILNATQKNGEWECILRVPEKEAFEFLKSLHPEHIELSEMSLEDVFAEYTRFERGR